jgi:hypothetical protein
MRAFMEQLVLASKVKIVLLLLSKAELGVFSFPLAVFFQDHGMEVCIVESLQSSDALATVLKTLYKSSKGAVLVAW